MAFDLFTKVRRKAGWFTNDLLWALALKSKNFTSQPFQRIIVYHGIDIEGNTRINSRFVSQQLLEEHLKFYSEHFHVVSVAEYFEGKFHSDKPTVAITFDDGYENNYSLAFPLLKKYKIPASFYVTTIRDSGEDILWPDILDLSTFVNQRSFEFAGEQFCFDRKSNYVSQSNHIKLKEKLKLLDHAQRANILDALPGRKEFIKNTQLDVYWRLLSEAQIREMSDCPLITIGAHGYYHNCLDKIKVSDARNEIRNSKTYLEKVTGKKIEEFAYPDGKYTSEHVEYAASIGLTKQLLGGRRLEISCDPEYIRTRMTINPHISVNNQISAFKNGSY